VRSLKRSYLQGGVNKTGDPVLTNEAFHAIHSILSLNLEDHGSLVLFVRGQLLKKTLLLVFPAILVHIPIRAFMNPAPIYS